MRSQDSLNKQIALYGEPLGTRFGRLLRVYRISQSRLAGVMGISAPMLSQLASGQRVKISNPAVYGRLLRLEQLAETRDVRSGDSAALRRALEEVTDSTPRLTLDSVSADRGLRDAALRYLTNACSPTDLERAADAVAGTPLEAILLDAAVTTRARSSA